MGVGRGLAWIAEWIVKPAGLMKYGVSSSTLPSRSIFTSDEAVISSNSRP